MSEVTMSRNESAVRPGRLTITSITPVVIASASGDTYAAKRVVGDVVEFSAVVVCDGAAEIGAQVRLTDPIGGEQAVAMTRQLGYRFTAEIPVERVGRYSYVVDAWVDRAATMQSRLDRKRAAGQAVANEEAELRMLGDDTISDRVTSTAAEIVVDRRLASFAGWYELFPRSTGSAPGSTGSALGEHGTLRTCIDRLADVASMGFDILYLPPIHPIGRAHRKGKNNSAEAQPGDAGSPWAIGAAEGGHTSVHPGLGTIDDFDALVVAAKEANLEIALDIAFQCSPDHPWVTEHPEWFTVHPDGTIAYAENPPKRYQDIVPFNFDSENWRELWDALADVIRFWHNHGIRVFRVDNPHTKPFRFWEWLIAELKADDPGIVFLAEAFAHPEVMMQLARVGFSVSYTHFPWQHSPFDLEHYFGLLSQDDRIDYFRGSAWVNTPDILTEELQQGLAQVFMTRLVLAATLSASYGVYGPVYELMVAAALENSEEYEHGEKYEVRTWDLAPGEPLRRLMTQLNTIRRDHAALQHDRSLVFHHCDNQRMVAYSKTPPRRKEDDPNQGASVSTDAILCVVNTDHHNAQDGVVRLDLRAFGFGDNAGHVTYEVHDLLSDQRFTWHGADNYVSLDPWVQSAHVFAIRRLDANQDWADTQRELA
jgi:starch synthase (maltosyl-transferring)